MSEITVMKNPDESMLKDLGVYSWPIWEKEASEFPWAYDTEETCYFLDGDVVVTTDSGEVVEMGEGDLVTFPAGLSCRWLIKEAVKNHYRFA